jgi:hypothetical protein
MGFISNLDDHLGNDGLLSLVIPSRPNPQKHLTVLQPHFRRGVFLDNLK